MTRKSTLSAWATRLGADLPADPTAAQLEVGIDDALTDLTSPPPTISQALLNNWAVIRAEVPSTVKAIASNLLG